MGEGQGWGHPKPPSVPKGLLSQAPSGVWVFEQGQLWGAFLHPGSGRGDLQPSFWDVCFALC